jgi:hypothetical protein
MGHVRRAMAPGGVLAVNLVTGAGHRAMQVATRRVLREEFGEVRTIRSEEAMNEVLVAGEAVARRRRLREYVEMFRDRRDRAYWDRLELRRLT